MPVLPYHRLKVSKASTSSNLYLLRIHLLRFEIDHNKPGWVGSLDSIAAKRVGSSGPFVGKRVGSLYSSAAKWVGFLGPFAAMASRKKEIRICTGYPAVLPSPPRNV